MCRCFSLHTPGLTCFIHCYCYDNTLFAVERKVGHLELRGCDPTREGRGTTFQARCLLQESCRKMEKRKKPVLVPRQHFGVNGGDCCAAGWWALSVVHKCHHSSQGENVHTQACFTDMAQSVVCFIYSNVDHLMARTASVLHGWYCFWKSFSILTAHHRIVLIFVLRNLHFVSDFKTKLRDQMDQSSGVLGSSCPLPPIDRQNLTLTLFQSQKGVGVFKLLSQSTNVNTA